MRFEPAIGIGKVAFKNPREHFVERRAVVEVPEVRDLVRDDRTTHVVGGLNQPPIDTDQSPVRTAAPAALRTRQGDRDRLDLRSSAVMFGIQFE